MKNLKRILCLCLALFLLMSFPVSASAMELEEVPNYIIDENRTGSLTIFKYDWTNAVKDGVWNENSFISTGWQESYVEEVLGGAVREGDANDTSDHPLGNGETSHGYALKGVQFTIARVADIVTYSEPISDGDATSNGILVLYEFDKTAAAPLLDAIGLPAAQPTNASAEDTRELDPDKYYFTSDELNRAMADAFAENSTAVKDALEDYVRSSDEAIVMDRTNEYGKTSQEDLELGLWLVVETEVPESVVSTTNSFFVSVPMTTVSGDANSASPEGGHQWNYNATVYPKNETGIPTLTKEVREAKADGGNNDGTDAIDDGFAHTATASTGDTMEYQVISTLPTITSSATFLSAYNFYDTIDTGLTYNKDSKDVMVEFFRDKACTDKVATWDMDSGKFTVEYSGDGRHMTVNMTEYGLNEINGDGPTTPKSKEAMMENQNSNLYAGYSNYTARLTYTCTLNASAAFGANGNRNEIVLTWARTNTDHYDTLIDDTHVYTFGLNITKLFSDTDSETAAENGMFQHVKFKIYNDTDGQWIKAELDEDNGIYYATGHTDDEAEATVFVPVTVGAKHGQIVLSGCENDVLRITELETANGYTLLKDDIYVEITVAEDEGRPCDIYSKDIVGVLQNDPHYSFDGGLDLEFSNIPQTQLAHNHLTATAKVDGNAINMQANNGSLNAAASLTIMNTAGFDLPQTGDSGVALYSMIGIILMAGAAFVLILTCRKKKN